MRRLLDLARASRCDLVSWSQRRVQTVLADLLPGYRQRGVTLTADLGAETVALPPNVLAAMLLTC